MSMCARARGLERRGQNSYVYVKSEKHCKTKSRDERGKGRAEDDVDRLCWMWEHRADRKEAESFCIKRATASDYIHN